MSKIVKAEPEELALVEVPTGGCSGGGACGGDPPRGGWWPLSAPVLAAAPGVVARVARPPAGGAEAPIERPGVENEALPGMPDPEGSCALIHNGVRPLAMVPDESWDAGPPRNAVELVVSLATPASGSTAAVAVEVGIDGPVGWLAPSP